MKINLAALSLALLFATCSNAGRKAVPDAAVANAVSLYLTTPDRSALFAKQEKAVGADTATLEIRISEQERYQEMDGFGFTLTGGSALHIHRLPAEKRRRLLTELFGTGPEDVGVSYLRVSLGASDLDAEVFSYNDLPARETDVNMEKFSLAPDREHLIPVLQEILTVNPEIRILASPWSPPLWMKTGYASIGGSLKREYYDAYARYFVKYVEGMAGEGIPIDAVTVQNEPLHPGNNPSMLMPAEDQLVFVRDHLGPAFEKEGIATKIIIYDHNADRPDYPLTILNDPEASKYVDGSAFHLYGGAIENLTQVHEAHPDKNLYFTEQWIGAPADFSNDFAWHIRNLIIGASRHWCKTVLEWNLAADANQDPHTDGGCDRCLGALTIDGEAITRNPAYYIIAHASKFVRPGSVRIGSNMPEGLPNVAFKTPDGSIVVIVMNESGVDQAFHLTTGDQTVSGTLAGGAVGTYVWPR